MMISEQAPMSPRMERYELKYTIAEEMVAPIVDFLCAFCALDKYSSVSSNHYYRVTNLYLDSPAYHFLRMKLNRAPNRFNMRIRAYGDSPEPPYYLEIKQKSDDIIRKYRSIVLNPDFYKVFTEPGYAGSDFGRPYHGGDTIYPGDPDICRNKQLFERLVTTYNASPKVLTQYSRMAWVSEVDQYARVTFDRNLRFRPETEYNFLALERDMVSYDSEMAFDPGCSVVLELKCEAAHVPLWMIDLIKLFDLRRRGFSKYGGGVFSALDLLRYDNGDRVSQY